MSFTPYINEFYAGHNGHRASAFKGAELLGSCL